MIEKLTNLIKMSASYAKSPSLLSKMIALSQLDEDFIVAKLLVESEKSSEKVTDPQTKTRLEALSKAIREANIEGISVSDSVIMEYTDGVDALNVIEQSIMKACIIWV